MSCFAAKHVFSISAPIKGDFFRSGFIESRIVCAFKKIVKRDIEIIGKTDQGGVVGFSFAGFVSADCVLADI